MIDLVKVGSVAEVFNGKTPAKSEQRDTGHPVLKIRDVDEFGQFRGGFESFVDASFAAKHGGRHVKDGDTLILNAAHNASYVGSKTHLATSETANALATGEWLIIRCNPQLVDSAFMNYWIRSTRAREAIKFIVKGIHLYPKDVAELTMPLPPLSEQRRIVDILSRAESIVRLRRGAQQKSAELVPAIFLDMFGDPTKNPRGWHKQPITSVCRSSDDVKCGPFGTQLAKSEFQHDGVPLWGIKHVNVGFSVPTIEFLSDEKAMELDGYSILSGDIVMTRKGTIGNCALYPSSFPRGVMHSDLLRIRPDPNKCVAQFLSDQLHISKDVENQISRSASSGAVMPGINVGRLKSVHILVPPIELQRLYAHRVSQVRSIQDQQVAAIANARAAFDALLAKVFKEEK